MGRFFGKKDKEKELKDQVQQMDQEIEELSGDMLDQVIGAGDPFEDIPRVPTQPIDPELRKDS